MESIDILYLTISVCVALLTLFLSVTLIYLMMVLRDVVRVSDKVKDVVEKVDTYITKPLLLTKSIVDFVSPFIQTAEEKFKSSKKKSK
jgi:hypothetical protein